LVRGAGVISATRWPERVTTIVSPCSAQSSTAEKFLEASDADISRMPPEYLHQSVRATSACRDVRVALAPSAAPKRSARIRWLGIALEEAALGAIRAATPTSARDTGASSHGSDTAAHSAVKHSIVIAYWHVFTTGELYNDLGGDYFQRRDPAKATKRLVDKLEALGHRVTLEPVAT
jgi:hypothetical protein